MLRLAGAIFLATLGTVGEVKAAPADLAGPIETYRAYIAGELRATIAGIDAIADRITAHDLEGARKAWISARVGWERAEPVTARYFPAFDQAIDPWPDAREGFHAVEARLFSGDVESAAGPAEGLRQQARALAGALGRIHFTAQGILDGVASLAFEIGESKTDGGESAASGTSLADIQHNLEGIEAVNERVFKAALTKRDPAAWESLRKGTARLGTLLRVSSLAAVDRRALGQASEELALSYAEVAEALGLERPRLGED
jgi:iron uptake system EfeUOB component EfeO/EfeM